MAKLTARLLKAQEQHVIIIVNISLLECVFYGDRVMLMLSSCSAEVQPTSWRTTSAFCTFIPN
jgi:hypothetical protein